jgi:hypothetical protein
MRAPSWWRRRRTPGPAIVPVVVHPIADLNHPSLERRRAAEAAWRAEHAAHRAVVVARREAAGDA